MISVFIEVKSIIPFILKYTIGHDGDFHRFQETPPDDFSSKQSPGQYVITPDLLASRKLAQTHQFTLTITVISLWGACSHYPPQ